MSDKTVVRDGLRIIGKVLGWPLKIVVVIYLGFTLMPTPYEGDLLVVSEGEISEVSVTMDGRPLTHSCKNRDRGHEFAWHLVLRTGPRLRFLVEWRTPDGRMQRFEHNAFHDEYGERCLHSLRLNSTADTTQGRWTTLCLFPEQQGSMVR